MKLQKFVADTLTEVVNGVKEAQKAVKENGGFVEYSKPGTTVTGGNSKTVDFDVPVGVDGDGNLMLGPADGARIKFQIVVTFPGSN